MQETIKLNLEGVCPTQSGGGQDSQQVRNVAGCYEKEG